MKLFSKLLIITLFFGSFISCEKEEDIQQDETITTEEVTLSRKTDYGEDWVYFSFSTGAEVSGITDNNYQSNSTWDIAFNRYNVRTNSGTSGTGEGGALDMGELDFSVVVEAPETGYVEDSTIQIVESIATTPPTMMDSNGSVVFIGAIEFSGPPPAYAPNNHIYVVKTADGKYAKVLIKGFYNESGDSGYVNFKYSYQSDGSRSFE